MPNDNCNRKSNFIAHVEVDQVVCENDIVTLIGGALGGSPLYGCFWNTGVIDGAGFTAAIRLASCQFEVSDANGCENSDQTDVDESLLSTIDARADQTVCQGNQITLSGSDVSPHLG